jgi:DNA-binding NtrC family response regulator
MSHILPIDTVGNLDRGDEHLQTPSATASVGLTDVSSSENLTLRRVLDETEGRVILRALEHTGWNRKRAAVLLKISYRGLLYKIRRHSITPTARG